MLVNTCKYLSTNRKSMRTQDNCKSKANFRNVSIEIEQFNKCDAEKPHDLMTPSIYSPRIKIVSTVCWQLTLNWQKELFW